ncbi:LEAF RUST 10 DISEASE-RESISTANCE LOCUS RECEPTOR-LIKE PROTEIN KINASE-like 2.4 [Fagus crenata]
MPGLFNCNGTGSGYMVPGAHGPDNCKVVLQREIQLYIWNLSKMEEAIKEGFVVNWKEDTDSCSACTQSKGVCGYDVNTNQSTCYCSDQTHVSWAQTISWWIKEYQRECTISLQSVIGIIIYRRRDQPLNKALIFRKTARKNDENVKAFIMNYGSLAPKQYSYSEIKKMTNSFIKKLGQGGYGGVYKGKLLDGKLVAVKVLSESKGNGEEFINEVASISRTFQVNIVTLLGFCYEKQRQALIYEFMPNGSLDKFIYLQGSSTKNVLVKKWAYIDVKPQNILLDEDFISKISDYGLAKLCQRKESIVSMLSMRGTIGFIALEVFSRNFGGVFHKSDVYSYGMLVLEMVGGRKNFDAGVSNNSKIYFPDWVYKDLELGIDGRTCGVITDVEEETTRKMILVSLWCIQTNPSDRPSMNKVVEMLEGSLHSLQIPPKPYLCSPKGSPMDSSTNSEK